MSTTIRGSAATAAPPAATTAGTSNLLNDRIAQELAAQKHREVENHNRAPPGTLIIAPLEGDYYNAVVLRHEGDNVVVNFPEYDSDEYVVPFSSIKPRPAASAAGSLAALAAAAAAAPAGAPIAHAAAQAAAPLALSSLIAPRPIQDNNVEVKVSQDFLQGLDSAFQQLVPVRPRRQIEAELKALVDRAIQCMIVMTPAAIRARRTARLRQSKTHGYQPSNHDKAVETLDNKATKLYDELEHYTKTELKLEQTLGDMKEKEEREATLRRDRVALRKERERKAKNQRDKRARDKLIDQLRQLGYELTDLDRHEDQDQDEEYGPARVVGEGQQ